MVSTLRVYLSVSIYPCANVFMSLYLLAIHNSRRWTKKQKNDWIESIGSGKSTFFAHLLHAQFHFTIKSTCIPFCGKTRTTFNAQNNLIISFRWIRFVFLSLQANFLGLCRMCVCDAERSVPRIFSLSLRKNTLLAHFMGKGFVSFDSISLAITHRHENTPKKQTEN